MTQSPFQILLIEDNDSDADLVKIHLKKLGLEYHLSRVSQKNDVYDSLESRSLDLVICDYNFPEFNGFDVLEHVRDSNPVLPFILISGYIGEEKAVDAMLKGASDYVLKDNLERLGPAVKRELFHFREQQKTENERDEAIQKLKERIKEQECLYNISSLDEQSLTIPELFSKALNYLPFGFHHPEIAAVSIDFDGDTYQTDHFANNKNTLTCTSNETGKAPLTVSVSYTQEKSGLNDHPFLKEEHHLLQSVAENLALKINRIYTQNELSEKNDLLEKAYNLAQIGNWEVDLKTSEVFWSPTTKEIHEVPEDFEPDIETAINFYKFGDDSNVITKLVNKAIEKGEPYDAELKIITAKGHERWVRTLGEPEFEGGKCVRLFGSIQNIDKRKRAEEELLKSEQRFKSLVQDGLDMIAIVDEEVRYKYVAPTRERIEEMDLEIEEYIGKSALDHFHEDDRERLRNALKSLEPNESTDVAPFRYKGKDGEWRWMESTITNLTENPAIDGYVTNSRDVTERIEQEKKLEDIVENSTNLFYKHTVKDENTFSFTYVSPQSRQFLGCDPEEASEKWAEFITDHPANNEGYENSKHAIQTGEAQDPYELQLQKKSGEIIWVEVNEAPIVENGKTVAMVGSLTDITERKAALDKLISTEQKLREIVEHSTNLFFKHDVNHQLQYVSPQSYDFVGLEPEKAMKKWTDLITDHPKNEMGFKKTQKAIETGEPQGSYELQFKHVDGSTVWARVHEAPIVENGKTVAMVGSLTDITAQKKYEEKLEELSLVASKTTDIIIMTDADDRITWVNKAFEQLLGYTLKESLGKNPGKLLRGTGTNQSKVKQIQDEKAKKRSIDEVILNYTKEGREIWLDMTADPIFDENDEFKGYIAIDKDVTEQIKQQKKLQESVELYEIVTKATSDIIWDADIQNDIVNYNSNLYDVFGYEEDQVENTGDWWLRKIHPNDRDRVDHEFKKAEMSKTDRVQTEYRFQCADGSYKYVNDRAFIIMDEVNEPVRLIGAMQDITQQKEENLWLKLLESAIANTTEAIAILEERTPESPKRKILYVNNAFRRMTGFTENEILGNSLLKLMGPQTDRKAIVEGIHSLDRGEACQLEICYTDKTDEDKWAHISFAPVMESDVGFSHWICIGRDITDQRLREHELRESLHEKETLLMEIHHRVKNNLAVVSSMMQLQAMEETSESLQEKLYDSVARIRTMVTIHELLYESGSFSKIDFSVNLKKLVSMITETIQSDRKIDLTFDCERVELNVNQAIPTSLIVNEIITNAIKHAFKDRDDNQISLELSETDNHVTIKISDNGIGMSENAEKRKGSSLGLQLIDVLAKQLNSEYEYVPSKKQGTMFRMQFEKSLIRGIGNAYLK